MISLYKKELAHALNVIFKKYSPYKSTIANVVLRQKVMLYNNCCTLKNFRVIKFIPHHYFAYFVFRKSFTIEP